MKTSKPPEGDELECLAAKFAAELSDSLRKAPHVDAIAFDTGENTATFTVTVEWSHESGKFATREEVVGAIVDSLGELASYVRNYIGGDTTFRPVAVTVEEQAQRKELTYEAAIGKLQDLGYTTFRPVAVTVEEQAQRKKRARKPHAQVTSPVTDNVAAVVNAWKRQELTYEAAIGKLQDLGYTTMSAAYVLNRRHV